MDRRLVYIAAPLFTPEERSLNFRIREQLAPHLDVYLPQLDGSLLADEVRNGRDPFLATRQIFEEDILAIRRCDILLIILNGRVIDEGAAFELGVAWALGKICISYKDDPRQLMKYGDNPMINGAIAHSFREISDIKSWLLKLDNQTDAK